MESRAGAGQPSMLRKLVGAVLACAIILGVSLASGATEACDAARAEVREAEAELAAAVRDAANKSRVYQKCVREHGPLDCEVHKAQMRIANQRVAETRDTLRLAKANEKHACR